MTTAGPDLNLFGEYADPWRNEWVGLPAFEQEDASPHRSIHVEFPTEEDQRHFEENVSRLYHGKWCWYPARSYEKWRDKAWIGGPAAPRYPIYVISKGRHQTPLTANALLRAGVPFRIVVEPQEADAYAAAVGAERVLVLPFSNLGQGSIPARNWVWEHSIAEGHERHWILDDNLDGFYRLHQNAKRLVLSAAPFVATETFVDRYENVGIAGLQYEMFAPRRTACPPYVLNTRVYSCILLNNSVTHRWRGRYNEDTDLSIRILKDGDCSVLLNAFLANKLATMRMAGGNTDELYAGDGRLQMAESLKEQHPELVTVTQKWGRWQHQVDYRPFRSNSLRRRYDADRRQTVDELGMELTAVEEAAQ